MPKTQNKGKNRVFIVAEISANHEQNLKKAITMIKKAKECGVDAVKFQAYKIGRASCRERV